MTCSKGQSVQLCIERFLLSPPKSCPYETAKVLSIVYPHLPEGQRGVQLDREIGGSRWWLEGELEPADITQKETTS